MLYCSSGSTQTVLASQFCCVTCVTVLCSHEYFTIFFRERSTLEPIDSCVSTSTQSLSQSWKLYCLGKQTAEQSQASRLTSGCNDKGFIAVTIKVGEIHEASDVQLKCF